VLAGAKNNNNNNNIVICQARKCQQYHWIGGARLHSALCFSSFVIFLLVDVRVGLNWLSASFCHTEIKSPFIHSFIHSILFGWCSESICTMFCRSWIPWGRHCGSNQFCQIRAILKPHLIFFFNIFPEYTDEFPSVISHLICLVYINVPFSVN